jgi:DNA-binding CsgD family transcriptional regulator
LLASNTWDDLAREVVALLRPMDIHGFLITTRTTDSGGRGQSPVLSSLPAELQDCFANTPCDDDPVALHIGTRSIPLLWRSDDGALLRPPYAALHAAGVHAGWSVAARSENSLSRIDFYSSQADGFARPELHSTLLMLSCYLHDAVRTLWLRQSPKTALPTLTAREKQCLRWSASGKTSNEIGTILGISQNTVYFHLKKAATKFDVYGTRHAISRAMELGLL